MIIGMSLSHIGDSSIARICVLACVRGVVLRVHCRNIYGKVLHYRYSNFVRCDLELRRTVFGYFITMTDQQDERGRLHLEHKSG